MPIYEIEFSGVAYVEIDLNIDCIVDVSEY